MSVVVPEVGNAVDSRVYDHARHARNRTFLHWLLRQVGFRIVKLDRIDGAHHVPETGPAILVINHIAFIDPLIPIGCVDRYVVPLAKAEGFSNPLFGRLMKWWGAIPVRRDDVDPRALRQTLAVLEAGEAVIMAPEGTRHAALQEAKPGFAYVGVRSGAPIVPIAIEGTEGFPTFDLRRWRQPGAVVQFGRPFRFRHVEGRPDRELLRRMTEEAMYVLAGMLPEARRGHYGDLSAATTETIEFL